MTSEFRAANTEPARVALWSVLCIGTSLLCTFAFACATPLAGLAALLALSLSWRHAIGVAILTWLSNQAVGFLALHYPLDANAFGWGAALGGATLCAYVAASVCRGIASPALRGSAACLAAFAAYEVALYAATPFLGGAGAFTPVIVGRIFAINALTFAALAITQSLASVAAAGGKRRFAPLRG